MKAGECLAKNCKYPHAIYKAPEDQPAAAGTPIGSAICSGHFDIIHVYTYRSRNINEGTFEGNMKIICVVPYQSFDFSQQHS